MGKISLHPLVSKFVSQFGSQLVSKLVSHCREFWQAKVEEHTLPTPKSLLLIMLISAGLVWVSTHKSASHEEAASSEIEAVDTFVPAGFVLVPIEVENSQSLDSILGTHGVVDLYSATSENQKARRVASRIKIMRAPMNPSSFAVLATSAQAPDLVRASRFYVVIKNPHDSGTEVESEDDAVNPNRSQRARPSRLIVETVE